MRYSLGQAECCAELDESEVLSSRSSATIAVLMLLAGIDEERIGVMLETCIAAVQRLRRRRYASSHRCSGPLLAADILTAPGALGAMMDMPCETVRRWDARGRNVSGRR